MSNIPLPCSRATQVSPRISGRTRKAAPAVGISLHVRVRICPNAHMPDVTAVQGNLSKVTSLQDDAIGPAFGLQPHLRLARCPRVLKLCLMLTIVCRPSLLARTLGRGLPDEARIQRSTLHRHSRSTGRRRRRRRRSGRRSGRTAPRRKTRRRRNARRRRRRDHVVVPNAPARNAVISCLRFRFRRKSRRGRGELNERLHKVVRRLHRLKSQQATPHPATALEPCIRNDVDAVRVHVPTGRRKSGAYLMPPPVNRRIARIVVEPEDAERARNGRTQLHRHACKGQERANSAKAAATSALTWGSMRQQARSSNL